MSDTTKNELNLTAFEIEVMQAYSEDNATAQSVADAYDDLDAKRVNNIKQKVNKKIRSNADKSEDELSVLTGLSITKIQEAKEVRKRNKVTVNTKKDANSVDDITKEVTKSLEKLIKQKRKLVEELEAKLDDAREELQNAEAKVEVLKDIL